jgi:hypothetical protein
MAADLSEMEVVKFRLRTAALSPSLFVGLRHAPTRVEARVSLQPYLGDPDTEGWRQAVIPLTAFTGRGLPALSLMDTLFVTFENAIASGSGTVFLDDICFSRNGTCGTVADISAFPAEVNLMGGAFRTVQTGAAAISAGYHEDRTSGIKEKTGCVRISYGGRIGHDYGQGKFSYAIWETDLMGVDARPFADLVVRIRGEKGGERPNYYLDDGMVRRTVRAKELPALTTQWQDLHIPLEKYQKRGTDLSHLAALQLDFEWEDMSGTIYVSKVYLAPLQPKPLLAEKLTK